MEILVYVNSLNVMVIFICKTFQRLAELAKVGKMKLDVRVVTRIIHYI